MVSDRTALVSLALVWGIGYLWATRRRSPRAAGLGVGGLAGLLALNLVEERLLTAVLSRVSGKGPLGLGVATTATVVNTLAGLAHACCLVLVTAAVVTDRQPAPDDR